MYKKYMLLALAVAVIVPVSVFAVDQVDIEMQAKQNLDKTIEKLQDDIDKSTDQKEIEKLEKVLAGAVDLKATVTIGEQLKTATDEDKERLTTELKDKMDKLKEHAGDRYTHTVITPDNQTSSDTSSQSDEVSVQSAWFPYAYADSDITDFEFWKNKYNGCGSRTYNMEFSGGIDSGNNQITIDWAFPKHMYVDNQDDDVWGSCVYVSYEKSQLSHYGFDVDGIYYCGASVPDVSKGVSTYPCPYADSGELNVLSTWVDYEDDDTDNDRTINLDPAIRFLILN